MYYSKQFSSQARNQAQLFENQAFSTPTKNHAKPRMLYKFLGIFLAGWLLFSCGSDEPSVEALKKANAKDFSFTVLSVNVEEVSVEKIQSILKNPTGWTIKSIKIDDPSYAEVTGTDVKDLKIKIKKAGEFSFSVTLQKAGYEDFILKGVKVKVTFKADLKDFGFTVLELTGTEVSIEQIKKNLKNPKGWTVKSIKIADGFKGFAEVTGTSSKDFKIKIKKAGEFSFSVTLQKTGYEDFILQGKIKVNSPTEPPKKADPSEFAFPLLKLTGTNEVSIEQIKKNLKSPTGWTVKSIKIDDPSYAEVTGTDVKDLKIKIKKAGEFGFSVTLQKASYEDFVLRGAKIKVTLPTKKADPSEFSFPLLWVSTKEMSFATLQNNLTKPAGWTIKAIQIDDSFADVTGTNNLKITIKKSGTFAISIMLQKRGWVDFVLKGSIKASGDVFLLIFDKATKTITGVTDKTIKTINIPATIEGVAVTTIGEKAFSECRSLTSVTIPNSVTFIGQSAFDGCSSLTSITIPDSVTGIGDSAFFSCTSLTSVTISNSVTTIRQATFWNCSSLTSVTIPNSVTTIGSSAFRGCTLLASITIPKSVTNIGHSAFLKCKKLVVTIKQEDVTKIKSSAFGFGYSSYKVKQVKVPQTSLAAYKAASGWSAYASIMVGYDSR